MPVAIQDIEFAADGRLRAVSEARSQRWNAWPRFFPVDFLLDVDALQPPR